MPGWQGSRRKETLPDDWEDVIRPAILRRDKYRCRHVRVDTQRPCGAYANQVDHIDQSRRQDHSPANLQSLCEYHHRVKSSAEGGNAAAGRRKAARRRHPGIRN